MPFQHLIDEYNKFLINTHGTNLKYQNYYQLVHAKLFTKYKNDSEWFFNDIHTHHREFYIHSSKLLEMRITPPDTNLKHLLNIIGFVEGLDYIITDGNGDPLSQHSNIIYYNKSDNELLKLTDIVNVKNWRIFDFNHITQLIKHQHTFSFSKVVKNTELIFLTPRTFIIMAVKTNQNYEYSDYFVNNQIIYNGYVKYLKLVSYIKLKHLRAKSSDDKSTDAKSTDAKSTDAKSTDAKSTDDNPSQSSLENTINYNLVNAITDSICSAQENKCGLINNKLDDISDILSKVLISNYDIIDQLKTSNKNVTTDILNRYSSDQDTDDIGIEYLNNLSLDLGKRA